MIVLLSLGMLLGILYIRHQNEEEIRNVAITQQSLVSIRIQITLQETIDEIALNVWGHPTTINPAWFSGSIPDNALLRPEHPWVEIAAKKDWMRRDPIHVIATDVSMAAFWYNPRLGIIRARVPQMVSDQQTLAAYNQINDSHLDSLFPILEDTDEQDLTEATAALQSIIDEASR